MILVSHRRISALKRRSKPGNLFWPSHPYRKPIPPTRFPPRDIRDSCHQGQRPRVQPCASLSRPSLLLQGSAYMSCGICSTGSVTPVALTRKPRSSPSPTSPPSSSPPPPSPPSRPPKQPSRLNGNLPVSPPHPRPLTPSKSSLQARCPPWQMSCKSCLKARRIWAAV